MTQAPAQPVQGLEFKFQYWQKIHKNTPEKF
jgi:hypothetical protein